MDVLKEPHDPTTLNQQELFLTSSIKEPTMTGGGSMSSVKPMEGLHETGPPPFLKKTYEMVENPETDPVVSWSSESRNSFVVWDSHKLSIDLLPKYFKHTNFSSFIRQLNTYGFRKVDSGKWEFANEGFQRGKKHLLNNIKRRSRYNYYNNNKKQHLATALSLKTDINSFNVDISRLREQQQGSHNQLNMLEQRVRCLESKQKQFCSFLNRISTNPLLFFQHLSRNRIPGRKPRLFAMQQGHENQQLLSVHSELTEIMFPEEVVEQIPVEMPFEASMVDEELTANNESNIFLELEDLIKKPDQI